MNNTDLVSVIMPAHNSSKYIKESINSALRQTYKNLEIIIINDNSSDETELILKKISINDERIKIINNNISLGAAKSRNLGIKNARGRFIAFLDSDDIWLPEKLEKQIKFMKNKNIALSYTPYYKINSHGTRFSKIEPPHKINYKTLLKSCKIGCLTVVYDTHAIEKHFMPTNTKREDFATWLNILKTIDYAYSANFFGSEYRVYKNQSSSRKISMARENWRLYRKIENLNIIISIYYFSFYAFNGLLNLVIDKIRYAKTKNSFHN